MKEEDNYQFNYQKLLSFLGRKGQKGYIFARADNYNLISRINKSLTEDLSFKGINARILYLDPQSNVPSIAQIENAAKIAGSLIIANLFSIINDPEKGLNNLIQINFAREIFWQLNIPILFWADDASMHTIANQAPDLFSQRRHTTIHFTDTQTQPIITKFKTEGLEIFLDSEKFKNTQTDIAILERRLSDARNSGYPIERIATEIALPLAKMYAEVNLFDDAKKLIEGYATELNDGDEHLLADVAKVYYLLHDYERAIKILEEANLIVESRYTDQINNDDYPQIWFNNLIYLADWQMAIGHPEKVIKDLERADDLLTAQLETNEGRKRTLIIIKDRLAKIMLMWGHLEKGRSYYEESLTIAKQQSKNNSLSEQLQRDLSVIYNKLGDIEKALGNLQKAQAYFEGSLKIREQLNKSNPSSERLQRDLSVNYSKLGDIEKVLGNLQKARIYFEDGLRISEQLNKSDPLSEQLQRDLSVSYEKLGNIERALGDLQKALVYFEDSLKIREQLSKSNLLSEQLQRDLSVGYNKLGDIENTLGNSQKAQAYFEDSLKIREQLSKSNPSSERLQRDLSVNYSKLGDIEKVLGNLQKARIYFEDGLRISEQLNKSNPLSEELQRDLSISYSKLGNIEQDRTIAKNYYKKSLQIINQLIKNNPLNKQLKDDKRYYERKLKGLTD